MVESTFEDFPSTDNEETGSEKTESEELSPDDSLLSALSIVQKIVRRKVIPRSWASDGIDLVQGIVLRLLKWRDKYREKSEEMSDQEWKSFAARTAFNEINRHYSKRRIFTDVPPEPSSEFVARELVKGNSETEVCSLVRQVWREICQLTLRQRQALLLSSPELIYYLLLCGLEDDDLAEILNLSLEEWLKIKENLPLSEMEIANLMKTSGRQKGIERKAGSVKKARYEARTKLRRLQKDENS